MSLPIEFPLVNRYQAAWNEQCTRITQRQNVMQVYLTTAGVIFGIWFHEHQTGPQPNSPITHMDYFLAYGTSVLTVVCAGLMLMHNQIMVHLTDFMKRCEESYAELIRIQAGDTHAEGGENPAQVEKIIGKKSGKLHLFYFFDGSENVASWHRRHRAYQRLILASTLLTVNGAAIYLALLWESRSPFWLHPAICFLMALFAAGMLVYDILQYLLESLAKLAAKAPPA